MVKSGVSVFSSLQAGLNGVALVQHKQKRIDFDLFNPKSGGAEKKQSQTLGASYAQVFHNKSRNIALHLVTWHLNDKTYIFC